MNKKVLVTCAAVSLATVAITQAQIAVIDPTAIADILAQTAKVVQEIALLTHTYENAVNTYNQIEMNAKMLTGKSGWMYAMAPLRYPSSSNAYGTSGGWIGSLNSGLASVQSYEMATMRMSSPYGMMASLSSAGQGNFARHYSTIELNDGVAQNTMNVTGAYRNQASSRSANLTKLQNDSMSDDPAQNTEVGVLNKMNSATIATALSQQDTNNLLAAIADQQTIESKLRHDAIVDELNSSIAAQANAQQINTALWSGDNNAHMARLP